MQIKKGRIDSRRQGWVLVLALVAVSVFVAMSSTSIRWILRSRQSIKTERDVLQLQLLCDAGEMRAKSALELDANYRGEDWLDQDDLVTGRGLRVSIVADPKIEGASADKADALDASARAFQIVARMTGRAHAPETIQRSRIIYLPSPSEQ
jgi:type II secretory pathway component PulK